MKRTAKEGQVILAGYVGIVERKSPTLTSVSIANRKNKDETEWVSVAFTAPPKDSTGQDLAEFAEKYIQKGRYVTVIAKETVKGEYKNLYANAVELGPAPKAANA